MFSEAKQLFVAQKSRNLNILLQLTIKYYYKNKVKLHWHLFQYTSTTVNTVSTQFRLKQPAGEN